MARIWPSPRPLSLLLPRAKQLQAFFLPHHYRHRFFTHRQHPSTFSWNATIRALSKSEHPFLAVVFYYNTVICNGLPTDHFTYPYVLTAFVWVVVGLGLDVPRKSYQACLLVDVYVVNSLMRMYGNCGCLQSACRNFFMWDVVSWNVLIGLCVGGDEVFELFDEMVRTGLVGVEPNEATMLENKLYKL